jgi:hypothetical protein
MAQLLPVAHAHAEDAIRTGGVVGPGGLLPPPVQWPVGRAPAASRAEQSDGAAVRRLDSSGV